MSRINSIRARSLRSVLAAFLIFSAFPSAGAKSDSPAVGELDGLLEEMRVAQPVFGRCVGSKKDLVAERERLGFSRVANSDDIAACRAKFPEASISVEKFAADPDLGHAFISELVVKQLCLALALRNPGPCGVLEGLKGSSETGEHMCRRLYLQSLLAVELIGGSPDPGPACAAYCHSNPVPPPPGMVERVCPLIHKKDYIGACSLITEAKKDGYSRKKCEIEFQSILGAESVCAGVIRPGGDVCRASAAFRKAKESSDSRACGGDSLCRVLMGEGPQACSALDAEFKAQVCSEFSPLVRGEGGKKKGWDQEWERLANSIRRLDRDCILARDRVVSRFDRGERILKAAQGKERTGWDSRRAAFDKIVGEQKRLDDAYVSFEVGAGDPPPSAPYGGAWIIYNTPLAKTGCCGGQGHKSLGLEQNHGVLTVDQSGTFIKFSRTGAIHGVLNPVDGDISGTFTDSLCGPGELTGSCTSPRACSGTYSQSGGVAIDGEAGSESGTFRLAR